MEYPAEHLSKGKLNNLGSANHKQIRNTPANCGDVDQYSPKESWCYSFTTNMMRCLIIKAIEVFARSEEPIIAFL